MVEISNTYLTKKTKQNYRLGHIQSYDRVTMTKYHDQGNLAKENIQLSLQFQRVRIHDSRAKELQQVQLRAYILIYEQQEEKHWKYCGLLKPPLTRTHL